MGVLGLKLVLEGNIVQQEIMRAVGSNLPCSCFVWNSKMSW